MARRTMKVAAPYLEALAPAAEQGGAQVQAPALVRARVRIDAARVPRGIVAPQRRVRAGFVFSAAPREIVVSEDMLHLIESDSMLHVERLA